MKYQKTIEKEPSYLEVGATRLKDTGKRTVFETGSHKEIVEGRGRYDLIPLEALGNLYERNNTKLDHMVSQVLFSFHRALIAESAPQKIEHLYEALLEFINYTKKAPTHKNLFFYTQELSKLYEAGAVKYAARDWEKGRPMEVFINSALRHLFQFLNNEKDEQHDVAFIWNTLSLIDTLRRLPSTAYTLKEIKE